MNATCVPDLLPTKMSSSEKFSGRSAFGMARLQSSAHTYNSPAWPPSFLIHCAVAIEVPPRSFVRVASQETNEVRLRVPPRFDEIDKASLAGLEVSVRQAPAKEFVPQPEPIGIDDIALAVFGDLSDAAVMVEFFDVRSADTVRLSRQAHHAAQLMQRRLALKAERGQDIVEINGVFGVPVEVRA
jgi:hypothetical protein